MTGTERPNKTSFKTPHTATQATDGGLDVGEPHCVPARYEIEGLRPDTGG